MSPSSVTDLSALCDQIEAPVTTKPLAPPRISYTIVNNSKNSSSQQIRRSYLRRLGFVESSPINTSVTTPRDFAVTSQSNPVALPRRRVSFETTPPRIHAIPNRHSHSAEQKTSLWTSPRELRKNYARNVLEFRSENWDYRQCVEEDQFVWLPIANVWTLVHPVHVWHAWHVSEQPQEYQHCDPYGSPTSSPPRRQEEAQHAQTSSSDQQINLQQHFCRVMSAQQRR